MKPLVAVIALWVVLLLGIVAAGQSATPSPPPAPAPGSPATYKSDQELMDALRKATATAAGMTTSAVSNTDQYRINIVHRDKPAGAIAHSGNTELHYIIEGAGTLVTGGTIVRSSGATGAASIDNGVVRRVAKGDIAIIPASSPHWYRDVEGSITYLEVRWVAPIALASVSVFSGRQTMLRNAADMSIEPVERFASQIGPRNVVDTWGFASPLPDRRNRSGR
jgi:mannose-6-phosphate isomerase-like protein (cupin superfamily)